MRETKSPQELVFDLAVGKHLAFAPVAFAVTKGPAHEVLYANAVFRHLVAAGEIAVGLEPGAQSPSADLTPVLDRAFQHTEVFRDHLLDSVHGGPPSWSCTVWPVPGATGTAERLVIEVRDIELIERARTRQREIAERLLLGALREQDTARDAKLMSGRATHLANASRDLGASLDEDETRDAVRRLTLPRAGTWCIVDVAESNGSVKRLAVVHPDPGKRALAQQLERQSPVQRSASIGPGTVLAWGRAEDLTPESRMTLILAAHGEDNLRILREIGFGALLVVPLVVRGTVQGAITFVSPEGDGAFSADEITLATDLASRCAMALDNARLYREADGLRLAADLANQSKCQFLGNVSHELRTPLNAIGGYVDLMDMGIFGPATDEQRQALARVKANQQHLLVLITEILNFVRVESGRAEYRYADVSMWRALADVEEMLSGAIADTGLVVVRLGSDVNTLAWADPDRVRQILINLVMNAVKYTGPNPGTITLSCRGEGGEVVTEVSDTGPGIAAEQLQSIFEPFVQLTAGLTARRGGVGLGLAISRDLARAMGGDLTVESTVGLGSRFRLALPAHPPEKRT